MSAGVRRRLCLNDHNEDWVPLCRLYDMLVCTLQSTGASHLVPAAIFRLCVRVVPVRPQCVFPLLPARAKRVSAGLWAYQ